MAGRARKNRKIRLSATVYTLVISTQPVKVRSPSPSKDCSHTLNGFIGGGQTGYNWQSGNWVYGLEASFSGAKISGTETINFGAGPNTFATKIESPFWPLAAFLGYARDRRSLYVKAGYAGSKVGFHSYRYSRN